MNEVPLRKKALQILRKVLRKLPCLHKWRKVDGHPNREKCLKCSIEILWNPLMMNWKIIKEPKNYNSKLWRE